MSKAESTTTTAPAAAPHGGGKRNRTAPARRASRRPAQPASIPDLIAQLWHTLEWRKTLQVVFIITLTGVTVAAMLAGLALLVHAVFGTSAALPAGASLITVTVTYQAARRRRR
jgi:hypothetical protein